MYRYLAIFMMLFVATPAYAAKIALVIGNSDYDKNFNKLHLEKLTTPVNDATDMAAVLKSLGYEVILQTDVRKKAMKRAVRDFAKRLRQSKTVSVFYFAGHGLQYNNINYLVPLRADIQSEVDIEDEALTVDYVLRHIEKANRGVNIMILDACRSPIPNDLMRKNKGAFAGLNKGLGKMNAPVGGLMAYAAVPNQTSWGGLLGERNSVYTKHLLGVLRHQADLPVEDLFLAVRQRVRQATKNQPEPQVPWESRALTSGFCFGQCKPNVSALLRQCQKHFQANRLTTGQGGTALACYKKVLQNDKNNAEALAGLAQIEAKYAAWIARFLTQGKRQKAERFLARLRQVNPDSPKLAALEEKMQPSTPTVSASKVRPSSPINNNQALSAGKVFRDHLQNRSLGPEMVWMPAGQFQMGDLQGEGDSDEKPVHSVSVAQFAMSTHEVTVGEFRRFVTATGYQTDADKKGSCKGKGKNWQNPGFSQADTHPVVCVSWHDATAYAGWLSQQTGQHYRLPTEAEWEYAARAGSKTIYWWGNDFGSNQANCATAACGDRFEYTAPVGSFAANAFGLYDIAGNVWEWTCSEYQNSYAGAETRCTAVKSASLRVLRGGAWFGGPKGLRAANRTRNSRDSHGDGVGFRIARVKR